MTENLARWDAMKQPPPAALKPITGGRLKGKTDISPQWRYEIMTEQYGPCGIGWKYDIVKVWTEPGPKDQVFVFALVNVIVREGEIWSDPIPGIGGSMLVELEKSGLHANDEGYKMAVTDALSVALKMLGVAADIYNGSWDGSKYLERPQNKPKSKTTTTNQINNMFRVAAESGWSKEDAGQYIKNAKGVTSSKGLDKNEAEALTEYFKGTPSEKSDGPSGETGGPPEYKSCSPRIYSPIKDLLGLLKYDGSEELKKRTVDGSAYWNKLRHEDGEKWLVALKVERKGKTDEPPTGNPEDWFPNDALQNIFNKTDIPLKAGGDKIRQYMATLGLTGDEVEDKLVNLGIYKSSEAWKVFSEKARITGEAF